MKVLVDTSVWSLALRRRAPAHPAFLLCAIAERNRFPILTTDTDFTRYARILTGVKLLAY